MPRWALSLLLNQLNKHVSGPVLSAGKRVMNKTHVFFLCPVLPISNPHGGRVLFLKHNQVSSLPCSARSSPQHHLWVIKKDKPSGG